jgi:hypothetical protein
VSPDLELQGVVVAALKADAAVTAIVEGRVYDSVPRDASTGKVTAKFPFVSLGPTDEVSNDADCSTAFDIAVQIDCWSRAVGYPEVKRLADAVRRALVGDNLTLNDNALVLLEHRLTRTFRDPDPLTSHSALTFEAAVEQIT